MQEEVEGEPKIEQVEFSGKLTGSLPDIKEKVSHIPFYALQSEGDRLEIARIESRDIRKRPFLFYIMTVKADGLSVTYSIVPGSSDRLRRAVITKNVASVLSVIAEHFQVDETKFFQYVDSVIDDLVSGISQGYSTLFNKYDGLANEYTELKRLASELSISNRNLTIQTSQLNEENKALAEQIKSLQTYSDESLMSIIEDWIEVHNSSIDLDDFSKTYKVPLLRVEQILNKMVSLGYIELKS